MQGLAWSAHGDRRGPRPIVEPFARYRTNLYEVAMMFEPTRGTSGTAKSGGHLAAKVKARPCSAQAFHFGGPEQ
jgi:hypothetical protein